MPIPNTKVFLSSLGAGGATFTPANPGDFEGVAGGMTAPMTVAGIADLNGDLIPDLIIAAPGQGNGNQVANQNAGRIYVELGSETGGTAIKVGDLAIESGISGNKGGDLAGAAIGVIGDLNGDGRQEILIGAPGADPRAPGGGGGSTVADAGQAYVVWGAAPPQALGLGDIAPDGFIINGAAAGDRLGMAILSVADLNADGKAEILVGAPGNDLGGADAGAAYLVFGKANTTDVETSALGARGFRIRGEAAGDGAGSTLGTVGDLNGDGKAELLVGAELNDAGGADAGAVYVVFGKSTTSEVLLSALGTGGFRIRGIAGEHAGSAVAGIGDVNGDGRADILVGAEAGNKAYVVFGKADTTEVLLSAVAAGSGGFVINAEAAGDLSGMTVAAGGDLNRDGVADFIVGAPHNAEGGTNAGAVYIVWGGARGPVDLSLVSQGIGGAKLVGTAGSLAGSAVALVPDMNGDGTGEVFIGAPGLSGESARLVYAPASWQPDPNIYGTNGAETMAAGFGGLHVIGATDDTIYALGGDDSVDAGDGNDSVDGGAGNDTLAGGAGGDTLDGGTGIDSLVGGAGDDYYVLDAAADIVVEASGGGSDTVAGAFDVALATELEALVLTAAGHAGTGNGGANTITGSSGSDTLLGMDGADTLFGNGGADSLDGGLGDDSMAGGGGNDTYLVGDPGDLVFEDAGGGTDTVRAAIDYTLTAEVEALVLTGAAHHGTGNAGGNSITGGAGSDVLDGAGGADTLTGAGGDDLYMVDAGTDQVVEVAGGGTDTVSASVDYALSAEIEALLLTGAARHGTGNGSANSVTGNDLGDTLEGLGGADTLAGGAGADSLVGGLGADSMAGGAGDDTYAVDDAGDVMVEEAGGGFDTVIVSGTWTLADNIEAVVLVGGNNHLIGNAAANALTGSGGNDTLDGAGGADTMTGGAGDDTYLVDNPGDVVVELPGGGNDTMIVSINATIAGGVETLVLAGAAHHGTGDTADNRLVGGTGADSLDGMDGKDTLDGAGGADTMAGGAGDDTYLIGDAGDVVDEDAAGGFDTVVVASDWSLAENIEAVQLVGGGHALTGNAGNNELSGGDGNDTLDGGLGDDTELGGSGDDVLHSHSGRDTLSGSSGDDRYVLHGGSAHIEDFLGHDTIDASEATGDSYIDLSGHGHSTVEGQDCDIGVGGTTASKLDLQFLQDLTGSFGDDIAMVRGLVPQIVAAVQGVQPDSRFGVSTFRDKAFGSFGSAGDWVYEQTLALSADAAALTAAYTAMVASGGADGPEAQIEALMQLSLRSATVGFGLNAARFVVLFTDAPFHVAGEGLAAGIPLANNGDAVLDGTPAGTGEDYPAIAQLKLALEGANIFPIFAVAGGNDLAYQTLVTQLGRGAEVTLTADSSNVVAAIVAGLSAVTVTHIEDAWGGAGHDTMTGSDDANHLIGNGGNDSIDGGLGEDAMEGGAGDDSYVVDSAGDTVVEGAGGGRDKVYSAIDYVLATDLEDLVLTGGHHGTGNGGGNAITGDDLGATLEGLDGADTLTGGAGADSLDGGLGIDSMAGGAGDDIYRVNGATEVVVETLDGGIDTVISTVSWTLGSEVENLVLTGIGVVNGTGNGLANAITGNDRNNRLDGGGDNDTLLGAGGIDRLSGGAGDDSLDGGTGNDSLDGGLGIDVMAGGDGNDSYRVDATTDVVVEAAAGGTDTVTASATWAMADEVEVLVLIGNQLINGTGNALDNLITGNARANILDGGIGNDTLVGGLGRDTLTGGLGADIFRFGAAGEGKDTVLDFLHGTDAIEVSAAAFGGGLVAGMDVGATGHFVAGATAKAATGQFLFAAGNLFWDADGTGLGAKVALAGGLMGLTAADIHVIA